jgi:hypothetical protein
LGEQGVNDGYLTVSWNHETGGLLTLADGSSIFDLKFRVIGESGMNCAITASSSVIDGEAYDSNLDVLEIVSKDGSFSVTGDRGAMAGDQIQWYQNYPNPFSKETTLRFDLPETKQMRFLITDMRGVTVNSFDGIYEAGIHEIKWNGRSRDGAELPAGTYLLSVSAGDEFKTFRLVYIKE